MKTLQEMIDIRLIENSILIEGVVEDGMIEKFKVLEMYIKDFFLSLGSLFIMLILIYEYQKIQFFSEVH